MSNTDRSDRPIRRWISWVRPEACRPWLPLDALRRGAGEHRVLGGDPALAPPRHPAGHVLVHRRGAQHLRGAEGDEHGAGGLPVKSRRKVMGRSSLGSWPSARIVVPPSSQPRCRSWKSPPPTAFVVSSPRCCLWPRTPGQGRPRVGPASASSGPSSRRPQAPGSSRRRRTTSSAASRAARGGTGPTGAVEQAADLEGGLVGRGHEHDVAAHHIGEGAGQERVVGAAQQQGVDLGLDHRGQQPLGQHVTWSGRVSPRSTNSTNPGQAAR